jgi:hypothetical protein
VLDEWSTAMAAARLRAVVEADGVDPTTSSLRPTAPVRRA